MHGWEILVLVLLLEFIIMAIVWALVAGGPSRKCAKRSLFATDVLPLQLGVYMLKYWQFT
jgi:hypothetical protein